MAALPPELPPEHERLRNEDYEDDEEEEEGWDDWDSDGDDAASGGGGLLCLFCSLRFDSESSLFSHCGSEHRFGFYKVVKELGLDFYGCIKLINFVRSKVRFSLSPVDSAASQLGGLQPNAYCMNLIVVLVFIWSY